jgi:intergrase/recombinase
MGKKVQPVAQKLGLPHIMWRLLRHWGTTQMVEKRVPIKAAQQRLGHTRPDILLKHYAHVLDESTEFAAETLSSQLSGKKADLKAKDGQNREASLPIGSQTTASHRRWIM